MGFRNLLKWLGTPSVEELYQELSRYQWNYVTSSIEVKNVGAVCKVRRAPLTICNIAAVITDAATLNRTRTQLLREYEQPLWEAVRQKQAV